MAQNNKPSVPSLTQKNQLPLIKDYGEQTFGIR